MVRDISERVVIACKGRFNRAIARKDREAMGLPFENTITKDEFFEATLDDRRYVGFDTDPDYVALARTRLEQERAVPSD